MRFWLFLLIGIVTLLILKWIMTRLKFKKNSLDDLTTSNGIFLSGITFSVFYLMESVITPIASTMQLLSTISNKWIYAFDLSKHIALFIVIVGIWAFVTCMIAFQITKRFFKGKNISLEIDNNNVGLSILVTVVIICFSMLVKESIQPVLDSFVPYPAMPNLLN